MEPSQNHGLFHSRPWGPQPPRRDRVSQVTHHSPPKAVAGVGRTREEDGWSCNTSLGLHSKGTAGG